MNQILYTGGKNKKSGTGNTQKIIIFFAIFIIVFAICAIVIGANLLNKVKNENPNTEQETNSVLEEQTKSDVKVEFESQVGAVKVIVTSNFTIENIVYWWDEEEATTEEVNEKQYEVIIPSKQGAHTLTIEVTDENGYKKTLSQLVIGDSSPELTIVTDGVSNYVIKVKDDEEVDKIVIVLNGETQEVKVNAKEFEYIVEIPQGDSVIDVTVYNSNKLYTNKKAKVTNFRR